MPTYTAFPQDLAESTSLLADQHEEAYDEKYDDLISPSTYPSAPTLSTSRTSRIAYHTLLLSILLTNLLCFYLLSRDVSRVWSFVVGNGWVTDTRELPRPNPYDATFKAGEY